MSAAEATSAKLCSAACTHLMDAKAAICRAIAAVDQLDKDGSSELLVQLCSISVPDPPNWLRSYGSKEDGKSGCRHDEASTDDVSMDNRSRVALVGAVHGTLGLAERLLNPAVDIAHYDELCEIENALRRMLLRAERAKADCTTTSQGETNA